MVNEFDPGRIYRSKLWYQGKPILDQDGKPIVMRYQLLHGGGYPELNGKLILAIERRFNNAYDVICPGYCHPEFAFGYEDIQIPGEDEEQRFIWALERDLPRLPLPHIAVQWSLLFHQVSDRYLEDVNLIVLYQGQLVVVY